MVVEEIRSLLAHALEGILAEFGDEAKPDIELQRPARSEHGDLSANVALTLARLAGVAPRELAERIVVGIPPHPRVSKVEVAGPGFINFYLAESWLHDILREIDQQASAFGHSSTGTGEQVQVEFGSANPTGPIHVGNARNIVYGDALASVLAASGFQVQRENYVNDAGTQADKFTASLHVRYLQALGLEGEIAEDGYQGEYLAILGKELADMEGMGLIDKLEEIGRWGFAKMAESQDATLRRLGIHYDSWASQAALERSGAVDAAIARLDQAGHLYEHEGARWFRASDFGHSKDQVVIRSPERGGKPTYLAADAAYLLDKMGRGFDHVIYFWGADHHNTAGALRAVARALGVGEKVEIIIYQFVTFTGGQLSKRSGKFITLDELIDEVGADGARFTFLTRGPDSSMEFDFDLVKSQSMDNPVYYVQYAHARICAILRFAESEKVALNPISDAPLEELTHDAERALMRHLADFPHAVQTAAALRAPYRLTSYAREVAEKWHNFYENCRVISDNRNLTQARLQLARATRQVLDNCLSLLGVSAPERM